MKLKKIINKTYLSLFLDLLQNKITWVILGISVFKIITFPIFFKLLIFIFYPCCLGNVNVSYDTRIAQTVNPVGEFKF